MASFIKIGLFRIFNYANDRLLQKCSFFVDRSGPLLYNKAIERKSVKNKKRQDDFPTYLVYKLRGFQPHLFQYNSSPKKQRPGYAGSLLFLLFDLLFLEKDPPNLTRGMCSQRIAGATPLTTCCGWPENHPTIFPAAFSMTRWRALREAQAICGVRKHRGAVSRG